MNELDIGELKAALGELVVDKRVAEEAEHLSQSLPDFVREAWREVKPEVQFIHNWHITEICNALTAVSHGEIKRLQIWIPPQSMKSLLTSVMWPAWEWTFAPGVSYWTASYDTRLSGRLSAMSRDLMLTNWYQERWGSKFKFSRDAEHFFSNDRGGIRLATSPESMGTGYHGDRILLDDALRAADVTKTALDQVNDWYDGTVTSRGIGPDHARVIIMQRLHENDIAVHVLEHEPWEVLCLPERYEKDHPYAWRGDPRQEGQLLWPDYRPPSMSDAQSKSLGHQAAGQMQQRPAPREGNLLKRHWWRFYDPAILTDPKRKPNFSRVIQSIDTPLKDKESNDYVSIQAWGVRGADRFLLDIRTEHMNYNQAKRAIIEQARYVRKLYPGRGHRVLIENAGYGVELLIDLKRILTGVTKVSPQRDGNKVMRAESAADDLETGCCWLPGIGGGADETMGPARVVSANIRDFIESCAVFDNGKHDDDVDAWSQCMNWLRSSPTVRARTGSPFKRRRRTNVGA